MKLAVHPPDHCCLDMLRSNFLVFYRLIITIQWLNGINLYSRRGLEKAHVTQVLISEQQWNTAEMFIVTDWQAGRKAERQTYRSIKTRDRQIQIDRRMTNGQTHRQADRQTDQSFKNISVCKIQVGHRAWSYQSIVLLLWLWMHSLLENAAI